MSKYDWDYYCNGQLHTLFSGHASDDETELDCDPRFFRTLLSRMAGRRGLDIEFEFLGRPDKVTGIAFRTVPK